MNRRIPIQLLASEVSARSVCKVKVGAVISDKTGVFSIGWNHVGGGYGCHAEIHAIKRANKKRLPGSTIAVCGYYRRNNRPVNARPCANCMVLIRKYNISAIEYRSKGKWIKEYVYS